MYSEMRRKDRQLTEAEARSILEAGEYGTISSVGEDGQPYGTPISYTVLDDSIWIHCAKTGHKLRNFSHEPRVCFTVVGKAEPVYSDNFSTYFESAVVFGIAVRVTDDAQKIAALRAICEKYLPAHMNKFDDAIKMSLSATDIWKISIDHITGKAKAPK